jgi:hypothetical protein
VRGIVVLAAALAVGCGRGIEEPAGPVCTEQGVYRADVAAEQYVFGLVITVEDSLGGSVPARASLVARSGSYVETKTEDRAQLGAGGLFVLRFEAAGERAGTYDLTVRADGYADWVKTGVVVSEDECHVHTVSLTARMVRP